MRSRIKREERKGLRRLEAMTQLELLTRPGTPVGVGVQLPASKPLLWVGGIQAEQPPKPRPHSVGALKAASESFQDTWGRCCLVLGPWRGCSSEDQVRTHPVEGPQVMFLLQLARDPHSLLFSSLLGLCSLHKFRWQGDGGGWEEPF